MPKLIALLSHIIGKGVIIGYNIGMAIIKVGVLRGGPSAEHEISLKTGANVLAILNDTLGHLYEARDIIVGKDGKWSFDEKVIAAHDALAKVDVVFNALHGTYGEDGKLQHLLETHSMPFTGSGSLGSALGMNKSLAKKIMMNQGIKVPYGREFSSEEISKNVREVADIIFKSFPLPVIIKPSASGSSAGISIARNRLALAAALELASIHGEAVLVEDFIPGIEATCGVIENFRGQELYALPPVEIRPHSSSDFFDYGAKYEGKSDEIVPSTFSHEVKAIIEDTAKRIHRALGLNHYSRSDFIVHPRRGIYALEVNTLPGLTNESLMPKSLRAVGSDTHELVDHLIKLALRSHKKHII